MENKGTERTTISLSKPIDGVAKKYASSNSIKFSNLVEMSLEAFLKSKGCIHDDSRASLFELIPVAVERGVNPEQIALAITDLMERRLDQKCTVKL